jgi:tRNA-specific 2-thiouridylase
MEEATRIKAVGLLSGGLDSALALRIVRDQGVDVTAVNFTGPFGGCIEARDSAAKKVAAALAVPLVVVELGDDYLEIIKSPSHGYGSNVNPCIDCHIYMLLGAKAVMDRIGASFLVTGEVLGQRPMSQRLDTLKRIEKVSGLRGLILRPLSARLLDETLPEAKGWVKREDLLAISGRSRREQMRLAEEMGVGGYSSPAGGCLLTDPKFALRVRDLLAHGSLTLPEVKLLRLGRQFRLPGGSKLVVGRNQAENQGLAGLATPERVLLVTEDCPGPTALMTGRAGCEDVNLAAGVVARYSDGRGSGRVTVRIVAGTEQRTSVVVPAEPGEVERLMI